MYLMAHETITNKALKPDFQEASLKIICNANKDSDIYIMDKKENSILLVHQKIMALLMEQGLLTLMKRI